MGEDFEHVAKRDGFLFAGLCVTVACVDGMALV